MARPKKGSKENPVDAEDILKILTRDPDKYPFEILGATLSDGFCNYTYKVTDGIGLGDVHSVDGKGIVKDELTNAYNRLMVHMAAVDLQFVNETWIIPEGAPDKKRPVNIYSFVTDERTNNFRVTSFKLSGSKDDLHVTLTGTKYISIISGRNKIVTDKILLQNLSGYPWHEELKNDLEKLCYEVSEYKMGNYTPVETKEILQKAEKKKLKIAFPETKEEDKKEDATTGPEEKQPEEKQEGFEDLANAALSKTQGELNEDDFTEQN